MDPRKSAQEYTLDLFAVDASNVCDIVRGVLHMIFFHRHFPLIRPGTIDVLDLTLPSVPIPELEALIDSKAYQLSRQLSAGSSSAGAGSGGGGGGGMGGPGLAGGRGQLQIRFLERRRKPKPERGGGGLGWFGMGNRNGEEEICWETWNIKVTLATPRTEVERQKALRAMETTLQRTTLKIMAIANQDKEHIPAITNEAAFPYQIVLNPRIETRVKR